MAEIVVVDKGDGTWMAEVNGNMWSGTGLVPSVGSTLGWTTEGLLVGIAGTVEGTVSVVRKPPTKTEVAAAKVLRAFVDLPPELPSEECLGSHGCLIKEVGLALARTGLLNGRLNELTKDGQNLLACVENWGKKT